MHDLAQALALGMNLTAENASAPLTVHGGNISMTLFDVAGAASGGDLEVSVGERAGAGSRARLLVRSTHVASAQTHGLDPSCPRMLVSQNAPHQSVHAGAVNDGRRGWFVCDHYHRSDVATPGEEGGGAIVVTVYEGGIADAAAIGNGGDTNDNELVSAVVDVFLLGGREK